MPRSTDHETRRQEILSAAIELYLNSASPVSSEVLRKERKIALSSASVRTVFSELEDRGYLMHPHTSAGRVPTDDGYRFYLNSLMKKKKMSKEEANFIDKLYELKVKEIDDLLFVTSEIMSDFTHYASIVYFFDDYYQKLYSRGVRYMLEHPEFNDVRKARVLLEVLETKEGLVDLIKGNSSDGTQVYIGKECACPQMQECSLVVSGYAARGNRRGRLALVGPKRMAYDKVIPLIEYISEAVTRIMDRF
jgi:transcriptional regulator of heat shock response